MSTNGLTRFSRTMTTKFKGHCEFCGADTRPGIDHAARNGDAWIAVCTTCAQSITEQVKGLVRKLQAEMPGMSAEVISNAQTMLPVTTALQNAIAGALDENAAYDVLSKLQTTALYVKAAALQSDPIIDGLAAVMANAAATPKDRAVAADMRAAAAKWGKLTEKQASYAKAIIARYDGSTPAADANQPTETTDVPQGYYATPSRTGNNDLDFWRIDRPETGKWAGYTFVKRILGGHEPLRIRGTEAKQVLATIAATGIEAAGMAYAKAIGNCYACNRELTDEESRRVGLGPVCRNK